MSPPLLLFVVAGVAALVAGAAMPALRRWALARGGSVASRADRWQDDADRAVIVGTEQDALLVVAELRSGGITAIKPVCVLDPAGYDGLGHLRGMSMRSGPNRCGDWLERHPVAGAFVVRRDECLDPPVSRLVEQCLATGIPVHFLDISLALSGGTPSLSVGRPARAYREVVGGTR